MRNIYTLTVNPAIDLHYALDALEPGKANPARMLGSDSGGKGLNVSRALARTGVNSLAFLAVGSDNGREYLDGISGVRYSVIELEGSVRENINLHTGDGVTVISPEGPAFDRNAVDRLRNQLEAEGITEGDILVFSGRISATSDKKAIMELLSGLSERGVMLVLDSASLTVEDISRLNPLLIKPNRDELGDLFGITVGDVYDVLLYARRLHALGTRYVLVTLGSEGAALVGDGVHTAPAPSVAFLSATGAGDSAVAGFISALLRTADEAELLRYAVAFGSAATETKGTLPPDPCRIKELIPTIRVDKIL